MSAAAPDYRAAPSGLSTCWANLVVVNTIRQPALGAQLELIDIEIMSAITQHVPSMIVTVTDDSTVRARHTNFYSSNSILYTVLNQLC